MPELSPGVTLAVLGAAMLHAAWRVARFLKESFGRARIAGAASVVLGIICLKI